MLEFGNNKRKILKRNSVDKEAKLENLKVKEIPYWEKEMSLISRLRLRTI